MLVDAGLSQRQAANVLGVSKSVLHRELSQKGTEGVPKGDSTQRAITTTNHRAGGTGENEWFTPAQYVDAAREDEVNIAAEPIELDAGAGIMRRIARGDPRAARAALYGCGTRFVWPYRNHRKKQYRNRRRFPCVVSLVSHIL